MDLKTPLIYERHCSKDIRAVSYSDKIKFKIAVFLLEKSINKYKEFVVLNEHESKVWKGRNIKIIPNPLCVEVNQQKRVDNSKIAIAVGRHSHEKRYDKLIAIWTKVVEKYPDWVLKIYGEHSDIIDLQSIINRFNLQENIQLYDPINEIEEIYSQANMFLITSESESFGLVIIEAMAFGIPVIGYGSTSGTETLIEDAKTGFLVKKDDAKGYVEKIIALIESPKLGREIGGHAKKSLQKFDLNNIMSLWNKLFNSYF
nr:glycosyltransferase [Tamlana agarivorans]